MVSNHLRNGIKDQYKARLPQAARIIQPQALGNVKHPIAVRQIVLVLGGEDQGAGAVLLCG
jgi:hypothetical protein